MIGELIDAAVGDPEHARRLVERHPELLGQRWIHGETALHFLAVEGFLDGVRLLANLGVDPNSVNHFGDAPLIDVAVLGNCDMAGLLLEVGADPNVSSPTRDNAVHIAGTSWRRASFWTSLRR